MGYGHVATARLVLDAVVDGDLDEHDELMSDPAVRRHLPSRRHTTPERTAEGIASSRRHWAHDGLGCTATTWIPGPARERPPLGRSCP